MDVIMTFAVLSGIGMLAFSLGAFGVLDAYHKRHPHRSRVDWLISLYMFGVLLNVVAYLVYGRWWVAAPLVLMLLPADRAMRMRAYQRQRQAAVRTLNRTDSGSDGE
jgi:hypothetical protein